MGVTDFSIYGNLRVLGLGEDYISPKGAHSKTRVVQCLCGRTEKFTVRVSHLKSGGTQTCSLCKGEKISKAKFKDLTGKVFGNLEVLYQAPDYKNLCGTRTTQWVVRCRCGRSSDLIVRASPLLTGKSTGCKYCKSEKISKAQLQDLSGKTFGWLTVISRAPNANQQTKWWVTCKCGSGRFSTFAGSLINGTSTSCGCRIESALASSLKLYFSTNFSALSEYKIVRAKDTNHYLPYDIYIPIGESPSTSGIYIEINGEQHYKYIARWHKTFEDFKRRKKLDKIKINFAKQNGTYVEIDLRDNLSYDYWVQYILGVIKTYGCD